MRFLTSLLFILAATLSSFGAGGDAFSGDWMRVRIGDKVLRMPASKGTNVQYGSPAFSDFWQELDLERNTVVDDQDLVFTNIYDEIVTVNRRVVQSQYGVERLDISMKVPEDFGNPDIASVTGDLVRLSGSGTSYVLEPLPEMPVPSNNANENLVGNYYLDNRFINVEYTNGSGVPGLTPWTSMFSTNQFSAADVLLRFISGTRTNLYNATLGRSVYWTLVSYTENTNSLRKALGGIGKMSGVYRYREHISAPLIFEKTGNTFVSDINSLSDYYNAAHEFDDWHTNLIANTGMLELVGDSVLSNGVLYVDRRTDASSLAHITIPASLLSSSNSVYILGVYHTSPADGEYYYKWNGTTLQHKNFMSNLHWVEPVNSGEETTLDVWGSADYLRSWSMLNLVRLADERMVFADLGRTTRNTNCWVYGLDLTPFSTDARPGHAITRDCVAMANHYNVGVGGTLHFIGMDNEAVARTVVAKTNIIVNGEVTDACIGRLDSPLPDSITHCKLLPANYRDWLPAGTYSIPFLLLGKFGTAQLVSGNDRFSLSNWTVSTGNLEYQGIFFDKPYLGDLYSENGHINVWEGYSGHPLVLHLEGQPVLLTALLTQQHGPTFADMIPEINAAMSALGSTNRIETVDLSKYWH